MTLIDVDLAPEVVQMLDRHRATYRASRSDFVNYLIALYDQNTWQDHQAQQMQYSQQPVQQYRQPAYNDDSGYIGPVEGLAPVQTVRQSPKVCRDNRSISSILNGPRPNRTVTRPKSKTVPRKTR